MTEMPRTVLQPVTGTLSDLLSRWARLEPGRCRYERACYLVHVASDWHVLCGDDNALGVLQQGFLQMALQDALAEHDFDWTLSAHNGSVSATIVLKDGKHDNTLSYEITTYSEAMSLLWVYLEALSPFPCGLDA